MLRLWDFWSRCSGDIVSYKKGGKVNGDEEWNGMFCLNKQVHPHSSWQKWARMPTCCQSANKPESTQIITKYWQHFSNMIITLHYIIMSNHYIVILLNHSSLPGPPSLQVKITDICWSRSVLPSPGETPLVSPPVSRASQSEVAVLQCGLSDGEAPQSGHHILYRVKLLCWSELWSRSHLKVTLSSFLCIINRR